MDTIDLSQFHDDVGFTVILSGPDGVIAAPSLSDVLDGLSETLCAIGAVVDPAYELEVQIHDIRPGSIKIGVRLKKTFKGLGLGVAIYTATHVVPAPKDIIAGLFTSYAYDKFKPQEHCEVHVGKDRVRVKGSNCDVTIDREVYELGSHVRADRKVAKAARRLLKSLKKDKSIASLSVAAKPDKDPVFVMRRSSFDIALARIDHDQDDIRWGNAGKFSIFPDYRAIEHQTRREVLRTDLTVIRKSRNKDTWNFNWNGIKITAPITDPEFYRACEAHDIGIAPGYVMTAELTVTQQYLPGAKAWVNYAYDVTRVHSFGENTAVGRYDLTTDPTGFGLPQTPSR